MNSTTPRTSDREPGRWAERGENILVAAKLRARSAPQPQIERAVSLELLAMVGRAALDTSASVESSCQIADMIPGR